MTTVCHDISIGTVGNALSTIWFLRNTNKTGQDVCEMKEMGMGPAKGEFGHDPEVPHGRSVAYPIPKLTIKRVGQSIHVWSAEK